MAWATMVDMAVDSMVDITMARGLLMLMPLPSLMLIPTTMDILAMAMDWDMDMAMDSMVDMSMARGLLMLMPSLLLILTTMEATMAMVWDMAMVDMAMLWDMAM